MTRNQIHSIFLGAFVLVVALRRTGRIFSE